jgi:hypothetical protein
MKLPNFGLKTRPFFTDFFDPVSDPNSNPELISDPKRLFRFRIGFGSGQKFQILNTMQLLIGAELFGNVMVRYSEITSKYHIGA